MGFFDTLDDDADMSVIPDDPFFLPEDTYTTKVTASSQQPTKATENLENSLQKEGLLVNSMIIEGPFKGRSLTYWLYVPTHKTDDEEQQVKDLQAQSRLVKLFEALGFGIDEMRGLKPAALIGKESRWKTVNKKQDGETRINVVGIYPIDEVDDDEEDAFGDDDIVKDPPF